MTCGRWRGQRWGSDGDLRSHERRKLAAWAGNRRTPVGKRFKSGLLLTIGAWLGSRIVVGAAWGPARNPFSFDTSLWIHSDSINYLGIAVHGRMFGRCGSPAFPNDALIRLWHLKWCGTAGWLAGYPWLMQAMHWSGFSLPDSGVLISWFAAAVAIFLVWFGWGRDLPGDTRLSSIAPVRVISGFGVQLCCLSNCHRSGLCGWRNSRRDPTEILYDGVADDAGRALLSHGVVCSTRTRWWSDSHCSPARCDSDRAESTLGIGRIVLDSGARYSRPDCLWPSPRIFPDRLGCRRLLGGDGPSVLSDLRKPKYDRADADGPNLCSPLFASSGDRNWNLCCRGS